jgi:predicted secreted Zn-dependent protease
VKIEAEPVILMPKWSGYSSAGKAHKKEWDRMYKALEIHEDQHYMLFQHKLEKFRKKLEKAKPMTRKAFAKEWADFKKDHDKAQKSFDKSTGHGSKQGVNLAAPKEE